MRKRLKDKTYTGDAERRSKKYYAHEGRSDKNTMTLNTNDISRQSIADYK